MVGAGRERLASALIDRFFRNDQHYLATERGRADLATHLEGRTRKFARLYVPWLDARVRLRGRRLLEIGSGTGCSSLAFAHAGAVLTALDLDGDALACCAARFEAYGMPPPEMIAANAVDHLRGRQDEYDCIAFSASLEHMTTAEKLDALGSAWTALRPGGDLLVLECPNRLWFFDEHTSLRPFWLWLPDDLAARVLGDPAQPSAGADDATRLARAGRGVSFHEFALAGVPSGVGDDISSLQLWTRRNPLKALRWRVSAGGRYAALLRALAPSVHAGFLQPHLDVAIRKRAVKALGLA